MKLVCESLYEFQRGQDPMKTLELGGKLQQIKDWLSPFLFRGQYRVNQDYTIDIIRGDFIALEYIKEGIPEYIKFYKCSGSFIIDGKSLPDMIGCPRIIEGDFSVSNNKIEDLKGSPEEVYGNYIIRGNPGGFNGEMVKNVCNVHGRVIT